MRSLHPDEATEPVVNDGEGGVLRGAEAALQPSLCDGPQIFGHGERGAVEPPSGDTMW